MPIMTSLSTRFFGHPSDTKPTLRIQWEWRLYANLFILAWVVVGRRGWLGWGARLGPFGCALGKRRPLLGGAQIGLQGKGGGEFSRSLRFRSFVAALFERP